MINWLIVEEVIERMVSARESGNMPTPEQEQEYAASIEAANSGDMPRIMSYAGNSAAINVTGVLTDAPNLLARWFGGGNTTYREIRNALAIADADPAINEITLYVNSNGGMASAEWIETMEAVASTNTKTRAFVGNMAASAAYGLASQADEIQAQNSLSSVGSIGVVQRSIIRDDVVETASSNAPKKRPDATTEEGKSVIRDHIDAIEEIFIDKIASGRSVKASTVRAEFGQGGLVLAQEALNRGMIDSIAASGSQVEETNGNQDTAQAQTKTAPGGKKESKMDLETLKAQHPALYLAVFEAGKEQGVKDERDRVCAHLTCGEQANCMDVASKAIQEGTEMTQTLTAQYLMAATNKRDIESRDDDDVDANGANGAESDKNEQEEQAAVEEKVVDEALALAGINVEETK